MPGTKGNSGRPRKPTHLKYIQGTLQKCRQNPKEPKPDIAMPKAPKGLNAEVKKVFNELAELTYKMGVLSEFDVVALEICSRAVVEYRIASDALLKEGPDIKYSTKDGKPVIVRTSNVVWAESSFKRASSMLAKFGLTPADRSRVELLNPNGIGNKYKEPSIYDNL